MRRLSIRLIEEIEVVEYEETSEEATAWKNSTRHTMTRDHIPDHKMAKVNRPPDKDGV